MKKPTKKEITTTLNSLKRRFPMPGAMEIGTPYQSLVAILLSARTRDEQVLKLLPGFFKAFPTPAKLAKATEAKIQSKINTIGMYRQKAQYLKQMATRIVKVYKGKIPNTMEDLTSLAGVGRKTASVLLPYAFGKPAIAVDTHVHRVTNRLGWVKTKTPVKTEEALLNLIPESYHAVTNRVFVKLGRYVCISKPRCWMCPIRKHCQFKNKNLQVPKNADALIEDINAREDTLQSLRNSV